MGATERELPDLASLVGAFLGQCSPAEQRVLLAGAERIAADQYRRWADHAGDDDRDGFLAAAEREERVADVLDKLTPDAAETRARSTSASRCSLRPTDRCCRAETGTDQFAIQSAAERAGGALLRAFAERETDAATRERCWRRLGSKRRTRASSTPSWAVTGRRRACRRCPTRKQDEQVRELLEEVRIPNARSGEHLRDARPAPGLFRKWMPFAGKLLAGKLPARDRELLILRTAWHCRSPYEWGQHVPPGEGGGHLGRRDRAGRRGPDAPEVGGGRSHAALCGRRASTTMPASPIAPGRRSPTTTTRSS